MYLPQPSPREPFPPLATHTHTHACSFRPSILSIDHFQAALGIAVLGTADNIVEQAFLISRSQTDRKFSASEIRKWAERTTENNRRRGSTSSTSSAGLPSKVVADLLRKAADRRSSAALLDTDDSVVDQAFLIISRSQTDRKFSASSQIRQWAESKTTTSNGRRVGDTSPSAVAVAEQSSKVMADLLRKAAADPHPSSKKCCPCRSHIPERQLGCGVVRPPGGGEVRADGVPDDGGGSDDLVIARSAAAEESVAVLGRHFHVVASALLSVLCGRDEEGGCNSYNKRSSSSSSGSSGSRDREPNNNSVSAKPPETGAPAATGSSTAAEPAAVPHLSSSSSTKSTAAATSLSTMVSPPATTFRGGASSPPPCYHSSSSPSSSSSSGDDHHHRCRCQHKQQRKHGLQSRPSQQHQPQPQPRPKPPAPLAPPPPPPRLFVATASLSRLTSRAVEAETECSAVRTRLERVTHQLSEVTRQARASELELAATGASEVERVKAKLAAVVLEAAIDKAKLKEVSETGRVRGRRGADGCCSLGRLS